MPRVILSTLTKPLDQALDMANNFITVCPDSVWEKKFGGWPVWQQLYHAFGIFGFFLLPPDKSIESPCSPSIGALEEIASTTLTKESMRTYAIQMKKLCDDYLSGLKDSNLAEDNRILSAKFGAQITHGQTLVLMASHTFYHLGSCDAALRDAGLKGVF